MFERRVLLVLLACISAFVPPVSSSHLFVPQRHVGSLSTTTRFSSSIGDTWKRRDNYPTMNAVLGLRGGVTAEVSDIVVSAYDWCINLGAPSALVAGAVIATIYENIGSGALDVRPKDSRGTRFFKRLVRVLLFSSFAMEVSAIFTSTVCGTMLLSRTLDYMDEIVPVQAETTPLAFLRSNFEFEYLTARISFLQGLLNWVLSIALAHLIPDSVTGVARKMNKFIGYSLLTLVCLMLAFYNNHMTFYDNYWGMLQHWFQVTSERYIFQNPPRPIMYIMAPLALMATYYGIASFFFNGDEATAYMLPPHMDEDEDQQQHSLEY